MNIFDKNWFDTIFAEVVGLWFLREKCYLCSENS
jgi:hypothetical protein